VYELTCIILEKPVFLKRNCCGGKRQESGINLLACFAYTHSQSRVEVQISTAQRATSRGRGVAGKVHGPNGFKRLLI